MKNFIKLILSKILWKLDYIKFYFYYESIRKKYKIHPTFRFNGKYIYIGGEGEVIIGENSYIGHYSSIEAGKNCTVKIGKNCQISHNVRIYTTTMDAKSYIKGEKKIITKDVTIGDNCWIGANVFINPGVKIGNNCVIGANSVVSKDIPDNSIAVGAPIRVIYRLINGEVVRV